MTRLLIAGNDKIGRRLVGRVRSMPDLAVALDGSTDWRRVLRLVSSGRLPVPWLCAMAWAEWRRCSERPPAVPIIRTNRELLEYIRSGARQVFLFRAGLIVNATVLAAGADIINVHCASLPVYGGLGALPRALRDRAYRQQVTMHRVTTAIDEGPVLATAEYELDPARGYRENEDAAYAAGMQLLEGVLDGRIRMTAA